MPTKVGGSGVLNGLAGGTTLTVRDLVHLMAGPNGVRGQVRADAAIVTARVSHGWSTNISAGV